VFVERDQSKTALKKLQEERTLKNSTIYKILHPLPIEALLYIMAKTTKKDLKKSISNYVTHLRFTESILNGEDLKEIGLPPGRVYKQVLDALLKARLDGILKTREDEINFGRTLNHWQLVSSQRPREPVKGFKILLLWKKDKWI